MLTGTLAVLVSLTPAPGEREAARGECKIVAQAPWSFQGVEKPEQWVIRSREELVDPRKKAPEPVLERLRKERAEAYARALKVKALDFDKYMLVGVSAGEQPTGGYRVEITRAEKDDAGKTLTISWKLHRPGPDAIVTQALTYPGAVALVERFPGKVRFKQVKEE